MTQSSLSNRLGSKSDYMTDSYIQGFGSAFFADPDPGKNLHADPDPGGIRGRGGDW